MLQHQVDQPAQHLGRASNRKSLLVRAAGPAGSGRTPPGFAGLDDTVGVEQHPVTGFEAGLHDLDAANPPLAWLIEFELKHLSATIRQRELGAVRVVPTWGTRVAALRECGLRRGEQLAASRAADTSWAQRWQDAACAGANGISGNTAHPDTGAPHRATVWEV